MIIDRAECPFCDEEIEARQFGEFLKGHECDQSPASRESDCCPMCGGEYTSWLDHLKNCPAE